MRREMSGTLLEDPISVNISEKVEKKHDRNRNIEAMRKISNNMTGTLKNILTNIRQKAKDIPSALDMSLNGYMETDMTMEQLAHGNIDNVAREMEKEDSLELSIVPSIAEKIYQPVKNDENEVIIPLEELSYNITQCIYAYRSEEHEGTELERLLKLVKTTQPERTIIRAVSATEQDAQFFFEKVTKEHGGSIKNAINSL